MARPRNIVVLTGAGISAESGVPTFRAADGLWEGHRIEDVATPEGFAANPALVHAFYNARRALLPSVHPNAAHAALARLEGALADAGGRLLVVTQNVDNLHERAGSRTLLHMHGELAKVRCLSCGAVHPWTTDLALDSQCSACGRIGGLRPDIVWFGEMPYHMEAIEQALGACDLFVSIGTSGNVYPAAGFVRTVRYRGGVPTLELNLDPSEGASWFEEARHGPATALVPAWADEVIRSL
jgi:NAD-dependent deacetylase